MESGVISNQRDEEIAEYLINDGYEADIVPAICVLSGSRAYGLHTEESDRDYLGIHLANTWDILQHPDFRTRNQVIRKKFFDSLEEVPHGEPGGDISLDSFEFWKFISLFIKGSFVSYELLFLPEVHHNLGFGGVFDVMRQGLTNKIGRVAKGNALHDWAKDKKNRKKAIMAYYRLLQGIHFLREEEFEWNAEALWDYATPTGMIRNAEDLRISYLDPEQRKLALSEGEIEGVASELEVLIDEVSRAMMVTKLPERCPKEILDEILARVVKIRGTMI